MSLPLKKLDLFCGTGGVGKTTLAASRAVTLAADGAKVLLITIDPAKRLKQVMGLENQNAGVVCPVDVKTFVAEGTGKLDVLLQAPAQTLERVAKIKGDLDALKNPIVKILTRPYGGMNEIFAIIELQHQLEVGGYDHIVLDTPPGKHFIDFLGASAKINAFFDSSFIELFKVIGKRASKSPGFLQKLVSTGVKKLLSYLENVTGKGFVEEFVDAIAGIYQNKDVFLSALAFEKELKRKEFSNWFLVTSQEQLKAKDAIELRSRAKNLMHDDNFLVVNRSLRHALETWQTKAGDPLDRLRQSMLERQNKLKNLEDVHFKNLIECPEIFRPEPHEQVSQLVETWKSL